MRRAALRDLSRPGWTLVSVLAGMISYAARNGFVCQPGAWFKGKDGRRHLCQ